MCGYASSNQKAVETSEALNPLASTASGFLYSQNAICYGDYSLVENLAVHRCMGKATTHSMKT